MSARLVKRIRKTGAHGERRGATAAAPVARTARAARGARPPRAPRNATAGRILAAALEMFAERGFDGTTTRDIAARAAVNLGLIKYYFGGKERLWHDAVDEVVERLWRSLAPAVAAQANDASRTADVVRACVRFAARNPAFVRIMNDECKRNGVRMRWLVDRHGKRFYDLAISMLEAARERGEVPDVRPVHLYYIFIGAIGMIFSQAPECRRLTGVDPTRSEAMIEAHADAVVALFLRPAQSL